MSPSRIQAGLLLALHALAAGSAALILPGAAGAVLGAALLALGLAAARSRALLQSPASVRAIEISATELTIELASGARFAAEVAARRYVNRFLVTMPIRRPVRRTILVTRDMLDGDSFRTLRIWALWGMLPVAAKQLPAQA